MDNNEKKNKLILSMIFAIIILLVAGIVYQFVYIKKLEKQISVYENAKIVSSCVLQEKTFDDFLQN